MDITLTNRQRRAGLASMVVLLVSAVLIWLPALWTPFWGDDYVYLNGAKKANLAGEAWRDTFWPSRPLLFWRPLAHEAWWRIVEMCMAGNARISHAAMLVLHVLASSSVGWLAYATGKVAGWPHCRLTAFFAALLYGLMAVNLLPVHWVAAANSPLLVMFTCVLLSCWLAASNAEGVVRFSMLMLVPVVFLLGLLSKESAILSPMLMVVMSAFCGARWRRGESMTLVVCIALGVVWLLLRRQVTLPPIPEYTFAFGSNLPRNALSLGAWLLNVPREALRMVATDAPLQGAVWAALVALPVISAWLAGIWKGACDLTRRQWILLSAFVLIAYAPYFPLAWNSYAYYAAVAAILPAIVLARLILEHKQVVLLSVLLGVSSWLSVAGTRWLDHPGLIGRARWAENTLTALSQQSFEGPLWVHIADSQRFYAVGVHGLAWRLDIPLEQIQLVDVCPAYGSGTCLEMNASGSWSVQPLAPEPVN